MSPLHAFGLVITHGEQTGERWRFRCELCGTVGPVCTREAEVVQGVLDHLGGFMHQQNLRALPVLPPWRERAAWVQLLHRCREADEWRVRPKVSPEWGEL